MKQPDRPEGALGLADFIDDLRAELAEGSRRGAAEELRLIVDELTLSLDTGATRTTTGGASTDASAKFWVFASAEGNISGERSSERMTTQNITLTLKPQLGEKPVVMRG